MTFLPSDLLSQIDEAYRARSFLHLSSALPAGLDIFHPSRLLQGLMRLPDPTNAMHLAQNGEPLDVRRLGVDGRFDGGRLGELLDDGAALLLLGLEKWFASLQEPTRALAVTLKADISVNAYIGGPRSRGFREHVDHHDVLVAQVEGQKTWRLWEPTLPEPIELPRHQEGPPRRLLCELTLVRGDVLFIPRGVWHVAEATEDLPTAHLSFGVQPVTALHWLSSLRTVLMDELDWRREIPEDIESRRRWVNALRNSIAERLTLEELETYLKTRRRRYIGDQ